MPLVTHRVLFELLGENADSARDPVGAWVDQVDLTATRLACVNCGDDRLITVPRYEVLDVVLPDWLPVGEWVQQRIAWKYAWGLGVDPTWPEAWQRAIAYHISGDEQRLACIKLLQTKTFRSPFRRSMREQLETWCATPAAQRPYASPFSWRQWDKIRGSYVTQEARARSSRLYWENRLSGGELRGCRA